MQNSDCDSLFSMEFYSQQVYLTNKKLNVRLLSLGRMQYMIEVIGGKQLQQI